MPQRITVRCPRCGSGIKWVIDDDEDRILSECGCPGGGCQLQYEMLMEQIDEQEAEETRDQLGTWD